MNKDTFLQSLRQVLHQMPQEEIENAIAYYEEYFADAGGENEQAVLESLGTPTAIAAQIRADAAVRGLKAQPPTAKKGISAVWLVILAVFASPIALPLAIAVVALAFSLVVTVLAVLFALVVTVVALFAAGIVCVAVSFRMLFSDVGTGLIGLGSSMVCVGLSLLFGILAIQCSRWGFHGVAYLLNRLTQTRKEEKRL